ncbi:MAG: DNA primase, partial [Polyangiaceae bacterium]
MIGQETLDRVRREIGIVELIGQTVRLQKRGRSHVGVCPFHKEKTPSFHVNAERGFYYCFGCHESGDAIKFVQRIEGLEFSEAVRELCDRAGIEIVETSSEPERKQQAEMRRRQQELYEVGNAAAHYFELMLREHPLGGHGLAELDRRGLAADSPTGPIADALQSFRIGYAPYGWDGLAKYLATAGLSAAAAEKIGVIVPRKQGIGYYDRFRHRLMFAVLDLQGRVVAFSGRALPEPEASELAELGLESSEKPGTDPPAKYVNSPESPIYKKRETVFGLYQARQALRSGEPCVVVEGNFDVMSLHARGIKQVVAPLGTAFTEEQARGIRRFTQDVVLLFDGDSAGRRAVHASREPCRVGGLTAKVASLPDKVDPDELVRTKGVEAVQRVLKAARPMLEYLIAAALDKEFAKADAHERANRVREVVQLIREEDNPSVRLMAQMFADQVAGVLHAENFKQLLDANAREIQRGIGPSNDTPANESAPPSRARSRDMRTEIGREILGIMLDFPELLNTDEAFEAVALLDGDVALALAAVRQSRAGNGIDPEQVLAKLSASIHPFALARLAAPRHELLEAARTELLGNIKQLRKLELSSQKSVVLGELAQADRLGNIEEQ